MTDTIAAHLVISGRVQGVFFRSTMKRFAESYNIAGWVRNTESGEVEAVVQSSIEDVNRIIDWCHHGPKNADVVEVLTEKIAVQSNLRNFEIVH